MSTPQAETKDRDYKSQVLHTRITSSANSAKHLLHLLRGHVDMERRTAVKRDKFAHELRQAAQEEGFEKLQITLNTLANSIENEQSIRRQIMCQRYEENLLAKLKHYNEICFEPANKMLKDRDETQHKYNKAGAQVTKLHSKNEIHSKKYTKALEEQRIQEQRHKNVDFMLTENAQLYEYQRLKDMKQMITEFVHGYMAFHCRALENLSRVAEVLNEVDPQEGMDDMRDVLEGVKHAYTATEMATKSQKEADRLTSDLPSNIYSSGGPASSVPKPRTPRANSSRRTGVEFAAEGEQSRRNNHEEGGRDNESAESELGSESDAENE
eukprot:gb/GECG01016744.1/.p1 GENE.gb/GECG01016744.1/~~gb/GECG01016744.1/.p1  ORF type:complete len:325 (+),score=51.59 gb/GECG01016744.1/:1-975(+)